VTSESIFESAESRVRSYGRSFPVTLERAVGTEVWSADGRRYLDFLSGAGSLNYGHNHPVLRDALVEHILGNGITHSLDLQTVSKARFLGTFRDVILEPRGLDHVVQFTGPTGTNAVEAALKIARKVTGRSTVVSFTNGFHGVTLGGLSVTGNRFQRAGAGLPLGGSAVVPFDGYLGPDFDTLAYFERVVDDPSSGLDHPAAVIVETVQGEGGLNAAGADWLRGLERLCRERGILMIVDDIQAGCGRTGSFFSFETAGIRPDLITLSKSLSGFGLPFAVLLIDRHLDCWEPGEHNGTFRGNNHAFVTATKAIEHFWTDDTFVRSVEASAALVRTRLDRIVNRFAGHVVDVRGRGLMIGVRCSDPARAANVTRRAFDNGLIIERSGPFDEVIKLLLPLTTPRQQIEEGIDILEAAMDAEYASVIDLRDTSVLQPAVSPLRS
jgi:diaminobutyrate-2-oxoglutarate transaminase